MLELLKNYYVFMLILMVFSYLVPKESYKTYIQFFVGIFMVVIFLKPVLEIFISNDTNAVADLFEQINEKIVHKDFKIEEGGNIFEYFFFEGEGE